MAGTTPRFAAVLPPSRPAFSCLLALFLGASTASATRGGCFVAFLLPHATTRSNLLKIGGGGGPYSCARCGLSMAASAHDWHPLDPESLCSAPCLIEQTLCVEPFDGDGEEEEEEEEEEFSLPMAPPPRLALDKSYAVAVLDAWRNDEAMEDSGAPWAAEYKRVVYRGSDSTRPPLYGYLVRKRDGSAGGASDSATDSAATTTTNELPGVLLFHTAAGPNDVFLLYRAAALVNTVGCVAMVADLLSDGTGWGWRNDDKTRYRVRSRQLLERINGSGRPVLRDRVEAAVRCLTADSDAHVDSRRLAALGWCFGGHAIQELGSMQPSTWYSIRAMATFHGVFDTSEGRLPPSSIPEEPRACEVLLCTGTDDPFVPSEMVEAALEGLQDSRHTVSLLQLKGARHGFSNPGQAHNANQQAFGYDEDAARKSWRQAVALLRRRLARP